MANIEETVPVQNTFGGVQINPNLPENLTNPIYTPAFLREQIGKLMRVEFLIGTNNLTDRIGILEDVGASYILLRSLESDNITYCDIYAIKFITISSRRIWGTTNNMMNNSMNNAMISNPGINTTMMSTPMANNPMMHSAVAANSMVANPMMANPMTNIRYNY